MILNDQKRVYPMVKILIAQINPIVGDFEGNFNKMINCMTNSEDFDICLFPELTLSGYPPLDLIFDPEFLIRQNHFLERCKNIFPTKLLIVGGIEPSSLEKSFFNSAFLIHNGNIQASCRKMCLPTYDVFDEKRYFSEGEEGVIFEFMGCKLGISICEDLWAAGEMVTETRYSRHPFSNFTDVDILLNLSASPYRKGKFKKRIELLNKVAKKYNAPIFYCCQVGGNDGVVFDGGSMVVTKEGDLAAILPRFKECYHVIDSEHLRKIEFKEPHLFDEMEEAIVLGLRDYFYKQGFSSCLIGLSGGIDSALALYLSVKAFGAQHVNAFMLPSLFTSDMSIIDAYTLAESLTVKIHSAPLDKVLIELEEMLKEQTFNRLKGLTHQNMQSRLRGLFLMAMSNQTDALVITTGNKSEIAVGYSTLYGDTCGAISPLGDLFKTELYQFAEHIQKKEAIFPETILTRPPSAELAFGQKDEDVLPPYKVMDEILRLYIEEGYSKQMILMMKKYDSEIVEWTIKRLYQTEFKRQQYAPIIRISKKAFNIGRNIPIVQKFY